jgi:uncharacterized membrane protein YbhN (UPF0104 family)
MPADTLRAPAAPASGQRAGPLARKPWWPKAKKWLGIAFIVLVLVLVAKLASGMDWAKAWASLKQTPPLTLALAALLAAASHVVYATYDLIGRHETRHGLPVRRTMRVAFTSYAFNLNLGSLVGGVAFRYRLYSRLGLEVADVTRVLALSMLTNWLGYVMLGGLVLLLAPPAMPEDWALSRAAMPLVGWALIGVATLYVALTLFSRRREWTVRGHVLKLPSGRLAVMQLLLSMGSWMLIACIVWVLLQQRVAYPEVLAALLLAAVAGVITHVPAGLGVLEAVFIAMLSSRVPQHELLAALLAYRALYYLAPLAVACFFFWRFERRAPQVAPAQASEGKPGG